MTMDLSKRAMLVKSRIELRGLLGERRDQGATQHVEQQYNVAERRAKVGKFLIAQNVKSVKAVRASAQAIRQCVYQHTFAWLDTDMRLLPSKNHDTFRTEHDLAVAKHLANIESYINDYPYLVEDARHPAPRGLGELFDPSQYPPAENIKGLFKSSLEYWPMPTTNNFVADIAQEAAAEAKAGMERKVREIISHSFNDLVARSEQVVAHFVTKLAEYKPAGYPAGYRDKPEGIFRDSLVDNMTDLAKLIRNLNFTDDIDIEQMAVNLERLARYTPEQLRQAHYQDERDLVGAEGKLLLTKLDQMKKVDHEITTIMDSAKDYI